MAAVQAHMIDKLWMPVAERRCGAVRRVRYCERLWGQSPGPGGEALAAGRTVDAARNEPTRTPIGAQELNREQAHVRPSRRPLTLQIESSLRGGTYRRM